jgi:hypothetical protein
MGVTSMIHEANLTDQSIFLSCISTCNYKNYNCSTTCNEKNLVAI